MGSEDQPTLPTLAGPPRLLFIFQDSAWEAFPQIYQIHHHPGRGNTSLLSAPCRPLPRLQPLQQHLEHPVLLDMLILLFI